MNFQLRGMWLAKVRAANSARLLNGALRQRFQRQIHTSTVRSKWLTAEEARKVEEAPVGTQVSAQDNPVWRTFDKTAMLPGDKCKE